MYGQASSLQISLRHVQNDQLAQHNESLCFSSVFGKFRIANIYMVMVRCFRLREEMKLSQWCSARCGLVKEVPKVDIIFDASRISCARVPAFPSWIIHNTAVRGEQAMDSCKSGETVWRFLSCTGRGVRASLP